MRSKRAQRYMYVHRYVRALLVTHTCYGLESTEKRRGNCFNGFWPSIARKNQNVLPVAGVGRLRNCVGALTDEGRESCNLVLHFSEARTDVAFGLNWQHNLVRLTVTQTRTTQYCMSQLYATYTCTTLLICNCLGVYSFPCRRTYRLCVSARQSVRLSDPNCCNRIIGLYSSSFHQ